MNEHASDGLVEVSADTYHADQLIDQPTLSKSIIATLIHQSPAHARAQHPKLNPDYQRVEEQKFDVGNAAHRIFLEGVECLAILPYPDWRSKAAQTERDDARAAGYIPLLQHQAEEVQAMLAAVRQQLNEHEADPPLFTAGTPERTIVWCDDEFGVWCRARLDWLRDDHLAIDDLKTTSRSANPEAWTRQPLFSIGADLQAAFYLRGFEQLFGSRPQFRFVVVECSAPFALSVVDLGPDVLVLAEKKVRWAMGRWGRCLERGDWPGYERRVATAQLPGWEESRWLERELREEAVT